MNEPGLEFVWVGDDAIDPLQQAQTLQILVAAGIKTREEARADLGLGGGKGAATASAAGLGKYNHNHDERGRFATDDNAVATVGSPARKPRPQGVQVANLDNIATDATIDGGTANETSTRQIDPGTADNNAATTTRSPTQNTSPGHETSQSGDKPAHSQGMPIIHDVPDDAISLTAGDGTSFYAPPYADFSKVYAAGQANWQNPFVAISAIWVNGTYDFQRDNGNFYSAYTNASNYAVGVYMAGAGYSYDATISIGTFLANIYSSNPDRKTQQVWWTRGWKDATDGVGPFSPKHD